MLLLEYLSFFHFSSYAAFISGGMDGHHPNSSLLSLHCSMLVLDLIEQGYSSVINIKLLLKGQILGHATPGRIPYHDSTLSDKISALSRTSANR